MHRQLDLWDTSPATETSEANESAETSSSTVHELIDTWLEDAGSDYFRTKVDSDYQWPASRLTCEDMKGLNRLSNQVHRPVNQLIKEAVILYSSVMLNRIEQESAPQEENQRD